MGKPRRLTPYGPPRPVTGIALPYYKSIRITEVSVHTLRPAGKHYDVKRWALLDKPAIAQLLKNFSAFYVTRRFITVFIRVLHWSISCARSIQSIPPHPISLRSVLILSPTYVLVYLVIFFLLAFPSISYIHSSCPHSCCMTCPSHPPWLDHSNYVWRRVQVMKLVIMHGCKDISVINLKPKSEYCIRSSLMEYAGKVQFYNTEREATRNAVDS
jgi:hypothetical protein